MQAALIAMGKLTVHALVTNMEVCATPLLSSPRIDNLQLLCYPLDVSQSHMHTEDHIERLQYSGLYNSMHADTDTHTHAHTYTHTHIHTHTDTHTHTVYGTHTYIHARQPHLHERDAIGLITPPPPLPDTHGGKAMGERDRRRGAREGGCKKRQGTRCVENVLPSLRFRFPTLVS